METREMERQRAREDKLRKGKLTPKQKACLDRLETAIVTGPDVRDLYVEVSFGINVGCWSFSNQTGKFEFDRQNGSD
jgi:hypothetical protein